MNRLMKLLLCVALMAHVPAQGALESSTAVNLRGTQHVGSQEAQLKNNADMGILMRIRSLAAWCKNKIVAHPLMAAAGALGVSGVTARAVSQRQQDQATLLFPSQPTKQILGSRKCEARGSSIVYYEITKTDQMTQKRLTSILKIFKENANELSIPSSIDYSDEFRDLSTRERGEPFRVKVAENSNGQVVGFISFHKKLHIEQEGHIRFLAVDKSIRKKGIGTKLIKQALNSLKQEGVRKVDILSWNPVAIALYEKIGFKAFYNTIKYTELHISI